MNLALLITLIVSLLMPVVSGCGRAGQPTGAEYENQTGRSLSWNEKSANPVAGLDYGAAEYAKFGDDLSILLWTDLTSGGAQISSRGGAGGASFKGRFQSSDGNQLINFQFQAQGRNRRILSLDSLTYDLANGSLFLISTKGARPVVKQLKRDTDRLKVDQESLRAFAKTEPEITAFFASPEKVQQFP